MKVMKMDVDWLLENKNFNWVVFLSRIQRVPGRVVLTNLFFQNYPCFFSNTKWSRDEGLADQISFFCILNSMLVSKITLILNKSLTTLWKPDFFKCVQQNEPFFCSDLKRPEVVEKKWAKKSDQCCLNGQCLAWKWFWQPINELISCVVRACACV